MLVLHPVLVCLCFNESCSINLQRSARSWCVTSFKNLINFDRDPYRADEGNPQSHIPARNPQSSHQSSDISHHLESGAEK